MDSQTKRKCAKAINRTEDRNYFGRDDGRSAQARRKDNRAGAKAHMSWFT